jgi:hypothetical protein
MDGDARASEVLINSCEKTIGTEAIRIGSIDPRVCYGRMFFVKISVGDTIFLLFSSGTPSSTNYHVKLTDDFPIFDDAVVIGDITAIGTIATSKLSTYARGGFWNQK